MPRHRLHTRISYLLGSAYLLVLTPACKKFLQVEPAANLVAASAVFSSDAAAQAAVSGLYSQLVSANLSLTNGGASVFLGLAADELTSTGNPLFGEFQHNALSRTNVYINTLWSNAYKNLYHVNAVLAGLGGTAGVDEHLRRQLRGEAYLVRAFYYVYLAALFGDVPLVTGTDYRQNAVLPRTPVPAVYAQVLQDLTEAEALLPEAYPSANRVRPNKWAAQALHARVSLYLRDWTGAAAAATAVINSGPYHLEPALEGVFLIGSSETLWQLMRESLNTAEGTTFIPFSPDALPAVALRQTLRNAFEPGDQRVLAWLQEVTIADQSYFFPFKYKARGSGSVSEYLVVLRLAEQYLIRAEARVQQNNSTGARQDLDAVRHRAGLGPTPARTAPELLQAIEQERRVELFAEWGHRWLDLKRTGQLHTVLQQEKGSDWQASDTLFPLPQEEVERNTALTQNPGY